MEQKRFLTADEIFQTFGVDADALQELVDSGAVTPLTDLGTFKYRAEDFVKLVNDGKLTPRASGEMFISDSDGNIPFLVSEDEHAGLGTNEDLSFLELDEEALSEQAGTAEKDASNSDFDASWLEASDDSIPEMVMSDDSVEIPENASGAELKVVDDDEDVTMASPGSKVDDSDSDVRIAGFDSGTSDSDVVVAQTDSDVSIYDEDAAESGLNESSPSDSDVVLVKAPKAPDSDSDVRLSDFGSGEISSEGGDTSETVALTESGSSDGIRLFASPSDSDVTLAAEESGVKLTGSAESVPQDESASDVRLAEEDSGIRLSDADVQLVSEDSGISLVSDDAISTLDNSDSGISLMSDDAISTLAGTDSGISLVSDDAVVTLGGDDSGISLHGGDSGIRLDGGDSGISFLGADSGIRLDDSNGSGISLAGGDSGITLDDEDPKPKQKGKGPQGKGVPGKAVKPPMTTELSDSDLQDSGFDVSLADDDEIEQTAELNLRDRREETPGYPATVVMKGPQKAGSVNPTLSETFQMDEPPEVEDLDISEDLEGAVVSDASDEEFAAVEEDEVFEASDDDFSAGDVEVAEEYLSDEEIAAPVSKVRKGPKEPEWGLAAVGPIAAAALTMLATVTVLWGGMATMWTGGEAPGPAAALISTLAGLSPF